MRTFWLHSIIPVGDVNDIIIRGEALFLFIIKQKFVIHEWGIIVKKKPTEILTLTISTNSTTLSVHNWKVSEQYIKYLQPQIKYITTTKKTDWKNFAD